MWNWRKNTPEYECWKVEHECQVNHDGSAGAMESVGPVAIINLSIKKHNIIYKEYLVDNTSSFNDV